MHNLFKNVVVMKLSTDIAAGSSHYEGKVIDTLGYNGVAFLATFGTVSTGATNGMHAEMSDSSGGGSSGSTLMIDVEGSATTGAGDDSTTIGGGCVLIDLGRPKKRYYQPVVDRATGNTVIDGMFGFLYNPEQAAVSQSTAANSLIWGTTFMYDASTGASSGS